MEKSYKREVAGVMLAFVAGLFLASMWFEQATQAAEFLTTPVFLFAGAAFGMDSYAKQLK